MPTVLARARISLWLPTTALAVALGAVIALNTQVGFLFGVAAVAALAVTAPAGCWALSALLAALTFKGLVTLGVLPSVATFLDIPLAWGALAVALLKIKTLPPRARAHVLWLLAIALAIALAWTFHPTGVLRPIVHLALLGEPFALLAALLLDPPGPRLRRLLISAAVLLLAIQVPAALIEWQTFGGPSDYIQGTLYGAAAGAHVVSAVVVVGAIWALAQAHWSVVRRLVLAAPLLAIPFLADAKQVILALPAVLLAIRLRRGRLTDLLQAMAVLASVGALITLAPAGRTAVGFLEQARSGNGGKTATASFVWETLSADPSTVVFGMGPAQTVSRAAFMTTDIMQRPDSPLRALDLEPADIAVEAQARALTASGIESSFHSGVSSALGVFGDLGLMGAAAYGGLLAFVFFTLRRGRSPEATAAAAGWAMFAVLGLVFDWWEQPPFSILLAVLSGLALSSARNERTATPHGEELSSPHTQSSQ